MNPTRLPLTSKYVASLPLGLDSHARCEVHASVFEPHAKHFARLATEPGLPGPVSDLLAGRLADRVWIPEIIFQAAYLVVRDLGFADDRSFHDWTFKTNREMFDKPLIRTFMRLMSPSLVTLGGSKRWTAFHRGSDVTPGASRESGGRLETTLALSFPEGLFSRTFLEGVPYAFLAALDAARGRDGRVVLGNVTSTRAEYTASWPK